MDALMEHLGDQRKASFNAGQLAGWAKAMAFIESCELCPECLPGILKDMEHIAKNGVDNYHPNGT